MSMKKKKRRDDSQRRKQMSRKARRRDARKWLPTQQGNKVTDVLDAYECWYGVNRLCAIKEVRMLGVPISEEYEAQVRDSVEKVAKARAAERAAKRAARRHAAAESAHAAKRAAKQRAATESAFPPGAYGDAALSEWGWDGDDYASARWGAEYLDGVDGAPNGFGSYGSRSIENTLLGDLRVLDLRVIERKIDCSSEQIVSVRITLEADPEVLAWSAWGLVFAIGAMSFAEADADLDFATRDAWTAGDMLRCLSFDGGRLCFHADRVRGRCMQTTIEIDREGRIALGTVNRGEAAAQWIAKLQDKARPIIEPGESGEFGEAGEAGEAGTVLDDIPF